MSAISPISACKCFLQSISGLLRNLFYAIMALLLMHIGKLYAQVPPVIVTGAATEISDLGVTLNGSLNVNSVGIWRWYYQIGLTEALELPDLQRSSNYVVNGADTGSNAVPLSLTTSGLLPNKKYFFRLVARRQISGSETIFGSIQSFTTKAAATPPTISRHVTSPDLSFNHQTAEVKAVIQSGSSPTKVFLQFGTTLDYGLRIEVTDLILTNTQSVAELTMNHLKPNTTYHYSWYATNAEGTVSSGNRTFNTLAAPRIETQAATEVTAFSAVLRGRVNPSSGLRLIPKFDFGTTTSFGTDVSVPGILELPSLTNNDVNIRVGNLTPNTTYHYRLVGQGYEPFDRIAGETMTFTTGPSGEAPTLQSQPRVDENRGYSAVVKIDGVAAGDHAATAIVEYGETPEFGISLQIPESFAAHTSDNLISCKLTELAPATKYYYRFRVTNASGFVYSEPAWFVTPPAPIVQTLSAKELSDIGAKVNGLVQANGNDCDVRVEWGVSPNYGKITGGVVDNTATVRPFETSYQFALQAPPETTIHYRVNVMVGKFIYVGENQSFKTLPLIPIAPKVHGLKLDRAHFNYNDPRPYVTWEAAQILVDFSPGSSPARLEIEYGTTESYGQVMTADRRFTTLDMQQYTAAVPMVLNQLLPNTTYHCRAKVTSDLGESYGPNLTFKTMERPELLTLPAVDVSDQKAVLLGSINPFAWMFHMSFEYGLTEDCELTQESVNLDLVNGWYQGRVIGKTENISAVTSQLSPATKYYYRLKAVNAGLETKTILRSEVRSFTTLPPQDAPSIQGELSVSEVTSEGARVSISDVRAGSSEAIVVLEYGLTDAFEKTVTFPEKIPAFSLENPSITLSGLTASTTYQLRVKVVNGQGEVYSRVISLTTTLPGAKPNISSQPAVIGRSADQVNLQVAQFQTGDAQSTVQVEYGTTTSYGNILQIDTNYRAGINITAFASIRELTPLTTYHARFVARNAHGISYSPNIEFTTLPRPATATLAATSVSDFECNLNATVNAQGGAYSVSFEWGTSMSLGQTAISTPGYLTGSSDLTATARITGLRPSTTYYYRINVGKFVGEILSFTTEAPRTLPVINGAVVPFGIRSDTASFQIQQNVIAGGADATVAFEYGTTRSYGMENVLSTIIPVGTSLSMPRIELTQLNPDTIYQGRFKVSNALGVTYSENIEFSTAFRILTLPATEVNDVTARVHGSLNPGGIMLSNIRFRWGTTESMNNISEVQPSMLSGVDTKSVSFPLVNLIPNTDYFYQLCAADQNRQIQVGQIMRFRTVAAFSPPSAPNALELRDASTNSLGVFVSNLQAGGATTTVALEYGTTSNFGAEIVQSNTAAASSVFFTEITINGLIPATTYYVRCRVRNAFGTNYGPASTFTTLPLPVLIAHPPTEITDLSATLQGETRSSGLTLFSIEFIPAAGGGSFLKTFSATTTQGSTSGTFFYRANVNDLRPNTRYFYQLKAMAYNGATYLSEPLSFTTLPASTKPTMTGQLSLKNLSTDRVQVTPPVIWSGSSNTSVVYEYGLTRSYGQTTTPRVISMNQRSMEDITISGLQPSTTYYIRCVATNAQGGEVSNTLTFTTRNNPILSTQAASDVTDISGILNGTVNPNGNTLNIRYQWGLTVDTMNNFSLYGSDFARFSNLAGTTAISLPSPVINGLRPSTTYLYRMIATDGLNEWTTPIASFTTKAPFTPPSLNGQLIVDQVTMNTASISFRNPLLNPALIAGASNANLTMEYGKTTELGTQVTLWNFRPNLAVGVEASYALATIVGLNSGTVYYVRLTLSSPLGTVYSNQATFTTLTDHVVSTVSPSQIGEFGATLSAQVITGTAVSTNASFEWGRTPSYGNQSSSVILNGSTSNNVSIPISNLMPNTTYHYRVRVMGYTYPTTGETVWYYGENRTFTTSPPSTPPELSGVPVASNFGSTSVRISQTYKTGSSATAVTMEYGTTESFGSVAVFGSSASPGVTLNQSMALSGLQPATRYFLRTKAVNAQGTTYSPSISFTTIPLPALELLNPDTITSNSAQLNGRQTNPLSTGFSYRFEWGTTTSYGSSVSSNLQNGVLSAQITGLIPDTTYYYRLVATDSGSTVVTSSGTFISAPSLVAPVLGENQSAYAITSTAATLWMDRVSAPATVIFDYGLTSEYGSFAVFPQSTSTDGLLRNVTVELMNLQPNSTYFYRCRAVNSAGTTLGLQGSFRTLPLPEISTQVPFRLGAKSISLTGRLNARNASLAPSFEIGTSLSFGTIASASQTIVTGSNPQEITATISRLLPETNYYLRLRARDVRGIVFYGEPVQIRTLSLSQAWRLEHFQTTDNAGIAADHANPSGDGISNLMKYALNLNPTQPSNLPDMSRIVVHSAGNRLGYSFTRDPEKRDLTYVVEVAENLSGPWTPIATSVAGNLTTGPGFVRETNSGESQKAVEVLDTVDMSKAPRRFIRLKVIRNGQQ